MHGGRRDAAKFPKKAREQGQKRNCHGSNSSVLHRSSRCRARRRRRRRPLLPRRAEGSDRCGHSPAQPRLRRGPHDDRQRQRDLRGRFDRLRSAGQEVCGRGHGARRGRQQRDPRKLHVLDRHDSGRGRHDGRQRQPLHGQRPRGTRLPRRQPHDHRQQRRARGHVRVDDWAIVGGQTACISSCASASTPWWAAPPPFCATFRPT